MSAIWGIINFNKESVDSEKAHVMKECFADCAIDRFEEMFDGNVYMGCGIQYITNEAKYEKAPTKNESYNFVSDSMIDNRDELCEKLSIKNEETVSDGEILEKTVVAFNEKANDYVRGIYTFVKYDKKSNEALFAGDYVGQRTVYYMVQDQSLYFASLMKPLKLLCKELKPNEEWLCKCISQFSLGMHTEDEQVPYADILRIQPATRIRAHLENGEVKLDKTRYWNPCAKRKKIKYKTDEEYKEHFRKLYEDCVKCVLRSSGETSILLSGGYDSSSVAAWAANELGKRGKKLYSFTSVPMDGYVNDQDKCVSPDETNVILAMVKKYPNIIPTFMKLPNMDIWGDRTDYMHVLEMPYKSPENLLWMYNGEKMAREKGARILLTGIMGNATVSYGLYNAYLRKFIWEFRWLRYIKEIYDIHKYTGQSRKKFIKFWWKALFSEKQDKVTPEEFTEKTFVDYSYAKKYGGYDYEVKCNNDLKRYLREYWTLYDGYFEFERMRLTGDVSQHTSLRTGVIMRDPTKDIRMIEFCRSIPHRQYTKKGKQRRLISVYLEDMLPKEVLFAAQGLQSADSKMRVLVQKDKILQDWLNNYERFLDNPRINCTMAIKDLKERDLSEMRAFELMRHIYTNVFLEFIEENFTKK